MFTDFCHPTIQYAASASTLVAHKHFRKKKKHRKQTIVVDIYPVWYLVYCKLTPDKMPQLLHRRRKGKKRGEKTKRKNTLPGGLESTPRVTFTVNSSRSVTSAHGSTGRGHAHLLPQVRGRINSLTTCCCYTATNVWSLDCSSVGAVESPETSSRKERSACYVL